jgi:hypothetical protein
VETLQFEAIKSSLRQTKDGYSLNLAVHPDDLPEDLMRDFVGARYMVVMVRIGDNEMPVSRELEFPGDHAVKMAGILCRDAEFWQWLQERGWATVTSEKECAEWLADFLNIQSRKELKEKEEIRETFNKLKKQFEIWKRS